MYAVWVLPSPPDPDDARYCWYRALAMGESRGGGRTGRRPRGLVRGTCDQGRAKEAKSSRPPRPVRGTCSGRKDARPPRAPVGLLPPSHAIPAAPPPPPPPPPPREGHGLTEGHQARTATAVPSAPRGVAFVSRGADETTEPELERARGRVVDS
ncbi:unnamed protein product [Urochloa humidicola]